MNLHNGVYISQINKSIILENERVGTFNRLSQSRALIRPRLTKPRTPHVGLSMGDITRSEYYTIGHSFLTMPKRLLDYQPDGYSQSKRIRSSTHPVDPLSSLSDELLVRTLSYLPVSQLVICERCVTLTNFLEHQLTLKTFAPL